MVGFTVAHVAVGAADMAGQRRDGVEVFRMFAAPHGDGAAQRHGHTHEDYVELTKTAITWLILMSTAVGYFFGHQGAWSFWSVLHTILGTLDRFRNRALNQWYEREADRKMRRTADRPIPSGRLSADRALVFGILLSLAGFAELTWIDWLAGFLDCSPF